MTNPKVTVLMAVYNGDKYLCESVDSILGQTYTDFEFIIINDGSTDNTLGRLESYSDPRITVFSQKNQGLTKSLNTGIARSRGDYIARMDADDISLPERLEKQVALMDNEPDVGVCGTWVETIGELGGNVWRHPIDNDIIKSRLLFHSALVHPSVMMRRKFLEKNGLHYNEDIHQSQDYDLWVRCAQFFSLRNLPEVLMNYRLHSGQIGKRHAENQSEMASLIQKNQLGKLRLSPDPFEFLIHKRLCRFDFEVSREFVKTSEKWLLKLRDANIREQYFPLSTFEYVLSEFWFSVCNAAASLGFWSWRTFQNSELCKASPLKLKTKIRFFFSCSIKCAPPNV